MQESVAEHTESTEISVLTVILAHEPDVVTAHQRARQVARLLTFDTQDQIRLATATSEIARNAFQYAGSGRVDFFVNSGAARPSFVIQVSDRGPGIANVAAILEGRDHSRTGLGAGIPGTRRLMDHFTLESTPGQGVKVRFGRFLPVAPLTVLDLDRLRQELEAEGTKNAFEELQRQNQDFLTLLETVRLREAELCERQQELSQLNHELEETNQGVVALYAELDQRAEALRSANDIKTRFLANMSHECRTPLNSILALTSLLQRHTDGALTPAQEKQVGYIHQAATEIFEMVNDLLDLAKVEAGKVEIRTACVALPHVFRTLRGMLRPLSMNSLVNLVIEEPLPGLTLSTDEAKLVQILRNLVSNALKFTERGEVRLAVRLVDAQMMFTVADTGIGVGLEHQQLIFQEFEQVDSPAQGRVKGTGLGLPISRKLAELLGGSLAVASAPGEGSLFTLLLPLGETDEVASRCSREVATVNGNESRGAILIIDDDEVARYLACELFRGTQYRLIEASSGSQGAELARCERPQLILLDLTMPVQDGFALLDVLKADPLTWSIPVVIYTSVTLRPEDLTKLAGRHNALLPKHSADRDRAFAYIREVLDEPYLFLEGTSTRTLQGFDK